MRLPRRSGPRGRRLLYNPPVMEPLPVDKAALHALLDALALLPPKVTESTYANLLAYSQGRARLRSAYNALDSMAEWYHRGLAEAHCGELGYNAPWTPLCTAPGMVRPTVWGVGCYRCTQPTTVNCKGCPVYAGPQL